MFVMVVFDINIVRIVNGVIESRSAAYIGIFFFHYGPIYTTNLAISRSCLSSY